MNATTRRALETVPQEREAAERFVRSFGGTRQAAIDTLDRAKGAPGEFVIVNKEGDFLVKCSAKYKTYTFQFKTI